MSRFERPRASRPSTSSSRGVSWASARSTGRVDGSARRTNASITRRVTPGASSESPAATTRIAAASSSAGASLSRKPEAPARSASKTYSSRSKVVSTSTLVGTPASTSWRVAARPSSTGIRMSISVTSGWRRVTMSIASCPLDASPTTSRSGSASSRDLKPARTMPWSSQTTMRSSLTRCPSTGGWRPAGCRRRARARAAPCRRTAPRARGCRPGRARRPRRRRARPRPSSSTSTSSRVGLQRRVTVAWRAPLWRRALVRPSWAIRYAARSRPGLSSTGSPSTLRRGAQVAGARLLDEPAELGEARLRGQRGGLAVGAQHPEEPAHLGQRLAGGGLDGGEVLGLARVVGAEAAPYGLGLDGHHADRVGHDVVQLAGDPGALLLGDRARPPARARPRAGRRGRRPPRPGWRGRG